MDKKIIRIGNASGFWGDDLNALKRQIDGGNLDYITSDYLAEITMGILMKQNLKDPSMGFVYDFIEQFDEVLDSIVESNTKIITNAGGINPIGLAEKLNELVLKRGKKLKIAAITGDNISDRIDEFYPGKSKLENMETGENFLKVKERILSANLYLGVNPVLEALKSGADIIIAGRVTDTAITLAPMIHEFGWKLNDFDKLASGIVAGHIIECGTQSTGGNFTGWQDVKNWNNIGFPIIEVEETGEFTVTKHENNGGLVSIGTVKEQLLYEMGRPDEYISPDVIADFSSIHLEKTGENRIRISGTKGYAPTEFLKISISYSGGYKASGTIIIAGDDIQKKAETFESILWNKLNMEFEEKKSDLLFGTVHNNIYKEGYLRFSVFDTDKKKIEKFSKTISALILSGPAGVAVTGGRPKVQEVLGYWPALLSKKLITANTIILSGKDIPKKIENISSETGFESKIKGETSPNSLVSQDNKEGITEINNTKGIRISDLAYTRSGDKGDMSNIGVIALDEEKYEILKRHLTPDYIKEVFKDVCKGKVIRYEIDNLLALNFLLEGSLGGGGARSLSSDPQGKLYAQRLLTYYL